MILSGFDSAVGVVGTTATQRANAIVMFARVLAQCPYSCVSKCAMQQDYRRVRILELRDIIVSINILGH